jgi:COMPASS component SWD1
MITVSAYGNLFIWNMIYPENWRVFTPEFHELEENVDYIEREDEFDIKSDVAKIESSFEDREENLIIDIETIDKNIYWSWDSNSETEDTDMMIVIPVEPEPDPPIHSEKSSIEHETGKRPVVEMSQSKSKRPKSNPSH